MDALAKDAEILVLRRQPAVPSRQGGLLAWHRALVRRRWTYPHRRRGRPALPDETVQMIVRLAKGSPRWGYLRIVGELGSARLPPVALSFLYRLVCRVLEVVRVHRMDAGAKDAEILVLRHQLAVLRRQSRPRFSWSDRALIAALARFVPRECWAGFLVAPETILRWHRTLVRRRWTYPRRGPGRPPLPDETVALIVRLALLCG